jgi:hypothetical protein
VEVRECARWYQALDAEIDAAGVRDAQYARLPGFPHLRVDRPLAALRDRAAQSDAAMRAYAERLHELDLDARRHELQNLRAMSGETARAQSLRRARDCGALMRGADLASAQSRAALLGAAKVPDDYSTGMRILGLYYLTQIPFAAGVRRWEQETREAFAHAPYGAAQRVRYAPPAAPAVSRGAVAGLLARATFDPLGQLLLSPRELDRLAVAYAPSFEIEVGGDYDRFGWLRWRRASDVPQVDAAEPTAYVHAAYTRYRDQVLLQLVYTIWFSERPRRGTVDLLAGRLDGLTWRVTLAPDGAPLLYDTIHPCGCYHMFFPTDRARPRPAPDPESREEWAFVPQTLPAVADGERPVVTLASGTHYVERVSLVRGPDSLVRYVLRSYDELRSLPRAAETASAFGPEGLIAGSERSERFFFWPMGIASAGTMRQWGRQATAFVGRRHFDDADLLEKRFELDL